MHRELPSHTAACSTHAKHADCSVLHLSTGPTAPGVSSSSYSYPFKLLLLLAISILGWVTPLAQNSGSCVVPTAMIEAVSEGCRGGTISLRLKEASGASPFHLVVNGLDYYNVTVGQTFAILSPEQSIWDSKAVPGSKNKNDTASIETGIRFKSVVDGFITGIRFYKGLRSNGSHVGSLWTASGTQIAKAVFKNETDSGWQVVSFPIPVYIKANTIYTASCFSSDGYYSFTPNYFSSNAIVNGLLVAMPSSASQPNGVFNYGPGFPTLSFNNLNYWVDVLFTNAPDTGQQLEYTLTAVTDNNGCSSSGTNLGNASIRFNPLPDGTISTTGKVCEGDDVYISFTSKVGAGPFDLDINGYKFSGTSSGVRFNTGMKAQAAVSAWQNQPLPVNSKVSGDSSPAELGVAFKAHVNGSITGIRFYKAFQDSGSHTVSLWTSDGTRLGTVPATHETPGGWQQVLFPVPVPVTSGALYLASYFTSSGRYTYDTGYFATAAVTNDFFSLIKNGDEQVANGVYSYGPGGLFPEMSANSTNYWVDLLFRPDTDFIPEPNLFQLVSVSDTNNCMFSPAPVAPQQLEVTVCKPSLMDSIGAITCSPLRVQVFLNKPVTCSSVATNGSDFKVVGPYPVSISTASGNCSVDGYTNRITIEFTKNLQRAGQFMLVVQPGSDRNTLIDQNLKATPAGHSISFTIQDTVDADFTFAVKPGCVTDTVMFMHDGRNGTNKWSWSLDNNITSELYNPQAIYKTTGNKKIRLSVSNGSCNDTVSKAMVLDPHLSAALSVKLIECTDAPVEFTGIVTGNIKSFLWDFGDGYHSTEQSPSHLYLPGQQRPANYTVNYMVTDVRGCVVSLNKKLELSSNCAVAVPTAFTPDGNGRNDLFRPVNLKNIGGYSFVIYNRWGQQLFATDNISQGWNGMSNGYPQLPGTYIWKLQYTNPESKITVMNKGTFILVR